MKEYRPGPKDEEGIGLPVATWALARIMVSLFGVGVMVLGLSLSVRLFNSAWRVLQNPEGMERVFDGWAKAMGGEELRFVSGGTAMPLDRIYALFVVLGGAMFLAWLALKIVSLGGSMIKWSAEDRHAVERFTQAARGRTGQPPPPPAP